MKGKARKAFPVLIGLFVIYLVYTDPTGSAGWVRGAFGTFQEGAEAFGTFLRTVTATVTAADVVAALLGEASR